MDSIPTSLPSSSCTTISTRLLATEWCSTPIRPSASNTYYLTLPKIECSDANLGELYAETQGYYDSFLSLDIITGLLSLVLVADVSSLVFSSIADFMEVRGLLTTIVITGNYLLVFFCCLFGFWDTSWQFTIWERYLMHTDGCFWRKDIDSRIRDLASKEVDGARYMRVVRFVSLGLFMLLTVFFARRMYRKWKHREIDPDALPAGQKRKLYLDRNQKRQPKSHNPADAGSRQATGHESESPRNKAKVSSRGKEAVPDPDVSDLMGLTKLNDSRQGSMQVQLSNRRRQDKDTEEETY